MKFSDELASLGCTVDVDAFDDALIELHKTMHPSWSVDQLLCSPGHALRMCAVFSSRIGHKIPDDAICRRLLSLRKKARVE